MRSRGMTGILLAGAVLLATGASSIDGIREAREWQHAGDMARLFNQPVVAYHFYHKVATTFPGTHHGRYCASRARAMRKKLRGTNRTLQQSDSLLVEFFDFFNWL